ncbi:MAG: hypothetical protein JWP91_4140 [Fibrobacteres bacterium]|nr:hypothetical protein [Fibrobacterota bacterium]
MLLIKLFFVAASLITQAYVFSDPPAETSRENAAAGRDSIFQATYGRPQAGIRDSSTAKSDRMPSGESCALR